MNKKILKNLVEAVINNDKDLITKNLKSSSNQASKHLDIYIYGYKERLSKAIIDDYPTTENYFVQQNKLSDFHQLVNSYIRKTPSKSYNLDFYPVKFANFIKKNYPDKIVSEIADLESEIIKVFQAEDSPALTLQDLAKFSDDAFLENKFSLRTAHSIKKYIYNVENYLSEFRKNNQSEVKKITSYIFIVRDNNEVKRHNLTKDEFYFLKFLQKSEDLNQAIDLLRKKFNFEEEILAKKIQDYFIKFCQNGFFKNN
ncbi:MAG: putative DNA-binding domain-containing protein [Rickettsiales bacterium]|nr:putative DNA-binding domain-containing protein [Rickettsiales bacterium]